jgi:hypothetical protein
MQSRAWTGMENIRDTSLHVWSDISAGRGRGGPVRVARDSQDDENVGCSELSRKRRVAVQALASSDPDGTEVLDSWRPLAHCI